MLGIWTDLPWWARLGIGFAIMIAGIVLIFKAVAHGPVAGEFVVDDPQRYLLVIGFIITGIGFGLLAVGGKTDAEKNGYRF